MKKVFVATILQLACLSTFAADCMKTAETQYDMNQCSQASAQQADQELNRIYQQILTKAKSNPIAVKKIRAAELAWIKYRDAQLAMYYPNEEPGWYGSFHPVCVNSYYEELTRNRITELKELLKPAVEGDMCEVDLQQ